MTEINRREESDELLIKQVGQGNEQAFERLVHKYEQAVFNTIYRYVGNQDDVKDLAQEIFIKVWRNAKKFKGKSKFSTWLYRITANHCLNYRRKRKSTNVSLEELTEHGRTPDALKVETDWEQKRQIELVRKAVNELPERQRMALVLAQYEGRSYKEIAEIMKVSLSSVESLIFRARSQLRKKLAKVL